MIDYVMKDSERLGCYRLKKSAKLPNKGTASGVL